MAGLAVQGVPQSVAGRAPPGEATWPRSPPIPSGCRRRGIFWRSSSARRPAARCTGRCRPFPRRIGEVITLYYYGELSLKEVGAAMGISPGAARTLLCRARKKLKTRLEGQLDIPGAAGEVQGRAGQRGRAGPGGGGAGEERGHRRLPGGAGGGRAGDGGDPGPRRGGAAHSEEDEPPPAADGGVGGLHRAGCAAGGALCGQPPGWRRCTISPTRRGSGRASRGSRTPSARPSPWISPPCTA